MKVRTVEFCGTLVAPDAPFPADLPQIAFSGRSNVGKSSLINRILGRTRKKVAHVSATPGKTQGLNFYEVNTEFFLVDLPGFGYAKAPDHVRAQWKTLVEGYLARKDGACGVVHLVDARRDPTVEDRAMLDYLAALGTPTLVAITKIDKLGKQKRLTVIPGLTQALGLDPEQVIPLSSKTGEGREELMEALGSLVHAQSVPAEAKVDAKS